MLKLWVGAGNAVRKPYPATRCETCAEAHRVRGKMSDADRRTRKTLYSY